VRPAEVLRRAADYLERHDVDSPLPTAEQLLANVLGTDRVGIYRRVEPLRGPEAKAFGRALCRRCDGVPTQHLTGETGFRHLTLVVRPGVFVPRPETEVVVEAALESLEGRTSPAVVDVGTGSGAIALAIKQERPDARVWAVDRSSDAVSLARHNAERLALDVVVLQSDLLRGLDAGLTGPLDLVVSNPPYIEPDAVDSLPPDARADPVEALVGGASFYGPLCSQSAGRLRAGGWLVVEIGEQQAEAASAAALEAGATKVSVRPDLAGRERVVVATWP
jgi:release factor glutamine methyltransferase